MLSGIMSICWTFLFVYATDLSSLRRLRMPQGFLLPIVAICFALFSYQRLTSYLDNPVTPIPGAVALPKYHGASFYTNVFPSYISYYTSGWTVGGIPADDAILRRFDRARWHLQKDKLNASKYGSPDYYFYAFPSKFAPGAEIRFQRMLDKSLILEESGKNYRIYRMPPFPLSPGTKNGQPS
jgi:hypothetical protein